MAFRLSNGILFLGTLSDRMRARIVKGFLGDTAVRAPDDGR